MVQKAELQTLISGMLTKQGRKFARISFARGGDFAEYIVPDCVLDKAEGFSIAELDQLKRYVTDNCEEILEKARGINPIKNWMGFQA